MVDTAVTIVVVGMAMGSAYAMAGIAFNLMHSTSKVLAFTTGFYVMLGGVLGAYLISVLGWPVWLGFLGTLLVGAVTGLITEFVAVRRVLSRIDQHLYVLSTLALSIIIQEAVGLWWGTEPRPFPNIFGLQGTGLADPRYYAPVVCMLLVLGIVEWFYRRTMYGKAFRAVSQDAFAARARGIPEAKMRVLSYAMAGVIGALTGFAVGRLTFAYFQIGHTFTMYGFIALAVGGLGSNIGAVIGGLILGVILELANYMFGGIYMEAVALGVLMLVLVIMPKGIFGVEGARRV